MKDEISGLSNRSVEVMGDATKTSLQGRWSPFITLVHFLLLTVRSDGMIAITMRALNNVCKQVERYHISEMGRLVVQPHTTRILVFSGWAGTAD